MMCHGKDIKKIVVVTVIVCVLKRHTSRRWQRCIQGFGGETREKEIIWNT